MRKIIALSFISLDGVMQAPGGPQEDTSGGFKYGGWSFVYGDEAITQLMKQQIADKTFDLLLGHRTYDIFAAYWPKQNEKENFVAGPFSSATKYVVSHSAIDLPWEKSVLISGDVAEEIKKLKATAGPDLQVHGSGNLVQTLLKNDLVDELWLKIYPITLGPGKKLFAEGTIPATFELMESKTSPKGVIVANYRKLSSEIKTGSFA